MITPRSRLLYTTACVTRYLTLPRVVVSTTVASKANADGSVDVTVVTKGGPALYVVLTSLAQGRFSDNAFLLRGSTTIKFLPFGGPADISTLSTSLRVEHLQEML